MRGSRLHKYFTMRRSEQPWRTNRSRVLRAEQTSAEDIIWDQLRGRRLGGLKFVRQAPVGVYFADFLCRARKIAVEIDGATHSTEVELAGDAKRTAALESLGYRIFRISNDDVFHNIDFVLDHLLAFIEGRAE